MRTKRVIREGVEKRYPATMARDFPTTGTCATAQDSSPVNSLLHATSNAQIRTASNNASSSFDPAQAFILWLTCFALRVSVVGENVSSWQTTGSRRAEMYLHDSFMVILHLVVPPPKLAHPVSLS